MQYVLASSASSPVSLLCYLGLLCVVLVDFMLSLSCFLPVELNPWALHRQI